MIIKGYSLTLYCNYKGCHNSREFTGTNQTWTVERARDARWAVNLKQGTTRCPAHRGKRQPKEAA